MMTKNSIITKLKVSEIKEGAKKYNLYLQARLQELTEGQEKNSKFESRYEINQ
jgi:hypothetical protein